MLSIRCLIGPAKASVEEAVVCVAGQPIRRFVSRIRSGKRPKGRSSVPAFSSVRAVTSRPAPTFTGPGDMGKSLDSASIGCLKRSTAQHSRGRASSCAIGSLSSVYRSKPVTAVGPNTANWPSKCLNFRNALPRSSLIRMFVLDASYLKFVKASSLYRSQVVQWSARPGHCRPPGRRGPTGRSRSRSSTSACCRSQSSSA
jgi:hypothetical protein